MSLIYRVTGSAALLLACTILPVHADPFNIRDSYIGTTFLNAFGWDTGDPALGYVNYVDQATAVSKNLSFGIVLTTAEPIASADKFVIRADFANVVADGAPGRDSVRITSHAVYSDSAIIIDVQHMPGGCGQWPAFWTVDNLNWPYKGEVDIIEGIHMQSQNLAVLHTDTGCSMPASRPQLGTAGVNDCDVATNGGAGCQTYFTDSTFGPALNGGGGGIFAQTRSAAKGISVYFWRRGDPNTPADVLAGGPSVNSDGWGVPQAYYPPDLCDMNAHFGPHNIVLNLDFCGPWASPLFGSAGCGAGTCEDFVKLNPDAFIDAYWEVNSLRVYTP